MQIFLSVYFFQCHVSTIKTLHVGRPKVYLKKIDVLKNLLLNQAQPVDLQNVVLLTDQAKKTNKYE